MNGPDATLDHQGILSSASMEALELRHQPFSPTPADGELFEDETTRNYLNDINNALYGNDDVLLVLGEAGSGRTTLLRQLAASSQSRIACFSVKGSSRFDTAHLFGSILDAFKTPVPGELKSALDALVPNLQGTFERYNRLSTIVLDDADQVPVEELKKLFSSVLYLNGHEEPLLRVLLASTPEFEEYLPDALPEGAEIRYASLVLDPMDETRAKAYLEFRLNQAGYFDELPLDGQDLKTVMEESEGYPGPIHTAAAQSINGQHGPLPDSILPPELVNTARSGNLSKMLLGGLACLMILAGLFMFMRSDGERSPAARSTDEYRTVETVPITTGGSTASTELEIVDPTPTAVASETATQSEATGSTAAPEPLTTAEADTQPAPEPAAAPEPAPTPEPEPEPEPAPAPAPEPEATPEPAPAPAPEATAQAEPEPAPADNSDADLLSDTATDAQPAATPAASGGVLESPTWIMVQDAQRFTVQMSASTDRASVESFLSRNALPPPNSIFSFNRNGATWYALVHGLFDDVPQARDALKALPEGALRNQPWIRRIGQVQASLKEQN